MHRKSERKEKREREREKKKGDVNRMTGLCRPYFSSLGVEEINKVQIASKQPKK